MDYDSKPEGYYGHVREEMLTYLPPGATSILDVGCGSGAFGKILKEKTHAEVWGIEYMEDEARKAGAILDKVFAGPCEKIIDELPDNYFDVIFFNDVLEHLIDPYEVLARIKSKLIKNGVVISSIPNVRFYKTFFRILFGKDWRYEDQGIMDRTHLRFFTGRSIERMYREAGYKIQLHEGINRTSSLRPYLYNLPLLFSQMDILYLQYATVAKVK